MWKNKFHIEAEKGLVNDPNMVLYFGKVNITYWLA